MGWARGCGRSLGSRFEDRVARISRQFLPLVNVSQIAFDGEVRSERFNPQGREISQSGIGALAKPFLSGQSCQHGCVEKAHLVYDAGIERGLVEGGAGLEHDAQEIAAAEFIEDHA